MLITFGLNLNYKKKKITDMNNKLTFTIHNSDYD